ncbi:hypothetical protein FACS1894127_1570 [Clostridia bacterium]|nr:hypothetical protein FACS1894127_1570 [Clostridia bacterium]
MKHSKPLRFFALFLGIVLLLTPLSFVTASVEDNMPLRYSFVDDFSLQTQGPVWYYQSVDRNLNNYINLAAVSPNGRWRQQALDDSWAGGAIAPNLITPANEDWMSSAITFVAPRSGFVKISAKEPLSFPAYSPWFADDGVKLQVRKNSEQVWPVSHPYDSDWKRLTGAENYDFPPFGLQVEAGDQIHFLVNMLGQTGVFSFFGFNFEIEILAWDPVVEYVDAALSEYTLSLYPGAVHKLTSTAANAVWTSDNPNVAKVDQNGVVTAISEGSAIIAAEGAQCAVTVSKPSIWSSPVSAVSIGEHTLRASVGVMNKSAVPYAPSVIFALYDGINGKMRDVKTISDISITSENSEIFTTDFNIAGVTDPVIKSFVWDDGQIPLQEASTFEYTPWQEYVSAIESSLDNSNTTALEEGVSQTYRIYSRTTFDYEDLQTWRFWYSNVRDSSQGNGQFHNEDEVGTSWEITSAYLSDGGEGLPDGSIVEGSSVPITFRGKTGKQVTPNEQFWTDPVDFDLPEGHYLCFTWTVTGAPGGSVIPMSNESRLHTFSRIGDYASQLGGEGFEKSTQGQAVVPNLFGVKKNVTKRIDFLGDSITQGTGTSMGNENTWVGMVARDFGPDTAVWNHGLGWARIYNAASDGAWLSKVKRSDEVVINLGVNDCNLWRTAEEWHLNFKKIVKAIRTANPDVIITVMTPLPFDYYETALVEWRKIRALLLTDTPEGVDYVFDTLSTVGRPAPYDGQVIPSYKTAPTDSHPSDIGAAVIGKAFLAWYAERDNPTPLTVKAENTSVQTGLTKVLTATVTNAGAPEKETVTWSIVDRIDALDSSITPEGLLTAGSGAGTVFVKATSMVDDNKSALAAVTIVDTAEVN